MKEFDAVRGAFWLIAFIMAVEMLMIMATAGACIWLAIQERQANVCVSQGERLAILLTDALAVALAMFGVQANKRRNGSPPKEPPS